MNIGVPEGGGEAEVRICEQHFGSMSRKSTKDAAIFFEDDDIEVQRRSERAVPLQIWRKHTTR